jgi:hypothetical protein
MTARHGWLKRIILATQENHSSKTAQAIVCETLSQNNPSQKRAGRMAQGVGLEFKHQYRTHTHTKYNDSL